MAFRNITEDTESYFRALGKQAFIDGAKCEVHLNPTYEALLSKAAVEEIRVAFADGYSAAQQAKKAHGA